MPKRSAEEAFAKKPLSAFAAAQARKAAQLRAEVAIALDENTITETSLHEQDRLDTSVTESSQSRSEAEDEPATAATSRPPTLSNIRLDRLPAPDCPLDTTLSKGEYVTCIGTYTLKVLSGSASIYGAFLTPACPEYEIYAPLTHALPTLVARSDSTRVVLRPLQSSIRQLQRLSPLWNRVWPQQCIYSMLHNSYQSTESQNVTGLAIEDQVQEILNRISNIETSGRVPKVLVVGGKATGKSTFCRLLLNSILTSPKRPADSPCFWMDLDPGQPEFCCPGQLSLIQIRRPVFGPSFTHPLTHPALPYKTESAHTVAANSPREAMAEHLAYAKSLMSVYADQFFGPLIINCPGWITGSGAKITKDLITNLGVTDVVLLESTEAAASSDIADIMSAINSNITLSQVSPRQQGLKPRPAAELRALQQMSYHHASVSAKGALTWKNTPLSKTKHWVTSYSGPAQAIDGILSYYEAIPLGHAATVLDQSPVSIVVVHGDQAFYSGEDPPSPPFTTLRSPEDIPFLAPLSPSNILPPLHPDFSSCLGEAIITRIDPGRKELLLSTPVSLAEISRATSEPGTRLVLVRGKLPVPDWSLLESVHAPTPVSPENWDLSPSDSEAETPYITTRRVPPADEVDAARAVGQSVWRPRHLPRRL